MTKQEESILSAPNAMDLLQSAGIISDNCIDPQDIANQYLQKAIEFLAQMSFENSIYTVSDQSSLDL